MSKDDDHADVSQDQNSSCYQAERLSAFPSNKMSGKPPPLTPQDYIHAIYRHSRRSTLTSSFPGRNYVDLAEWLLSYSPNLRQPNYHLGPAGDDKHWLAVLHYLEGHDGDRTQFLALQDLDALETFRKPSARKGNLLFLRGYLPASWIAELGSRYHIDPEFFARHLDFFGPSTYRNSFSSPSLVTTDNNIIHVYVSTILTNDLACPGTSSGFATRRQKTRDQLSKYKRQLPRSVRCGDSIVREYTVLSSNYAVIEQRISICVSPDGEGWIGLVWMDNGRSLGASPTGPWISDFDLNNHSSREAALPIIQHHQKMIFRKIGDVEMNNGLGEPARPLPEGRQPSVLPQCPSTLPLDYLSLLSAVGLTRRATSDVLHALIPVFAYAAFSEVAFLNLLSELIETLIAPLPIDDFRSDCFERLQEYEVILERHTSQLRHCLRAIRVLQEVGPSTRPCYHATQSHGEQHPRLRVARNTSRGGESSLPPPSLKPRIPEASTYTATGILEDYEDLVERCARLQSRTAAAMSTEMNRAMILESRRAIEQSERVKKLTSLATYFIPLTLAASIFGMNLNLFGQGDLSIWWYFVLAAPLIALTHLGSTLDIPAKKKRITSYFTLKQWSWRKQREGIPDIE